MRHENLVVSYALCLEFVSEKVAYAFRSAPKEKISRLSESDER